MQLVIFDIDGTLLPGSSERQFWRFLLRRGRQGPRQVLAYLIFALRYLPAGGIATFKKNKAYLFGLACEDIETLAIEFVDRILLPQLFAPVVQRLKLHQNRGDVVVILSGTLDPIARALAQRLGVTHVWGTQCAQRNGVYSAQPPELHPYAGTKLSLGRLIARTLDCALGEAYAYGDSGHDLTLMAAVGHPVAVQPDTKLARAAHAYGWEIIADDAYIGTQPS
jgi:HAD superfamily hydrolase (TIGR01490 family)